MVSATADCLKIPIDFATDPAELATAAFATNLAKTVERATDVDAAFDKNLNDEATIVLAADFRTAVAMATVADEETLAVALTEKTCGGVGPTGGSCSHGWSRPGPNGKVTA